MLRNINYLIDLDEVYQKAEMARKEEIKKLLRVYSRLCKFFNVSENYTDEELSKSYRKLLIKYYPDKPDGSLKKFDKVKYFYKKLKEVKNITQR